MQISDDDKRLLRRLQRTPSFSVAELAQDCGLTTASTTRRLERLREQGVLIGQQATINWQALGFEVQVSLRVTLDKTNPRAFDDFLAAARNIPEVLEIQTFLGRVDVRLHVLARDMTHYQQLYRSRILTLPHIADIEALMQIAALKEGEDLPL